MYEKLIGIFFILIGSSMYGVMNSIQIQQEYNELFYIKRILLMLRQEIQYYGATMSEACEHMQCQVKEPYSNWLKQLSESLEKQDIGSLAYIWKKSVQTHMKKACLTKREKERLGELGKYFGGIDKNAQLNTIDLYLEQINIEIEQQKHSLPVKKRLSNCFGIMGGLFISVLFL